MSEREGEGGTFGFLKHAEAPAYFSVIFVIIKVEKGFFWPLLTALPIEPQFNIDSSQSTDAVVS